MTTTVDVQDFAREVLDRSKTIPVVVDFWAAWCGPCRTLGPVLERLASGADGRWVLAKLDTDKHQDIAAQYGIRGIPNVKLFVDAQAVSEFSGAIPEQAVRVWLDRSLPDPLRKEVEQAEQLLQEGNALAAQSVLGDVLKQNATHERARVLLAGTYLESAPETAVRLVEGIEENSREFPVADAIRTFAALTARLEHVASLPDSPVKQTYINALRALSRYDYDGALENFIDVVRRDRSYDDEGARRGCIAIFKVLGDDHETTRKYRRSFSSALFV